MKLKRRKKKEHNIPITIRRVGDPQPKKEVYKRLAGCRIVTELSNFKHVRELAKANPGCHYNDFQIILKGEEFGFTYEQFKFLMKAGKKRFG